MADAIATVTGIIAGVIVGLLIIKFFLRLGKYFKN